MRFLDIAINPSSGDLDQNDKIKMEDFAIYPPWV